MSRVEKRSVAIRGHRTSFSLEREFMDELRAMAATRRMTLGALVAAIDETRPPDTNLSSALRLAVLTHLRAASRDDVAP